MPLRLVPIIGFVSGVMGVVLVPVFGWLSDKGPNPNRRKRNGVLVATSLVLLGIAVVIAASVLHLQSPDVLSKLGDNSSFLGNTSTSLSMEAASGKTAVNVSEVTASSTIFQSFGKTGVNFTQAGRSTSDEKGIKRKLPVTAGLAMLGFIVFEIGYDNINSVSRAWILACSPRSEHTSLLVLGLVMAAVGGISTAALARVDFPSLLKTDPTNSLLRLVVQISIQGAVIAAFIVLGMVSTLLSGSRLSTRLQSQTVTVCVQTDKNAKSFSDVERQCSNADNQSCIEAETSREVTNDIKRESTAGTTGNEEESSLKSCETSRKPDETIDAEGSSAAGSGGKPEWDQLHRSHSRRPTRQFLCKIFCICSGMFFTCGTSNMFTYYISDYVGKAVYGGNPRADADSDDLADYLTGVRSAAWGILVYMVTYLLINFVHTRILAVIGMTHVLTQLTPTPCLRSSPDLVYAVDDSDLS
ncbi:hypothetical protein BaRGS_00011085 [Batillaria attramentaria]